MSTDNQEQYYEDTLYGSYADVLFILFPFLVIALLRVWNEEGSQILQQPDLSIAAAILAGMSLGKFVLGLIGDASLVRYKERIVFFIALTIFLVLGPSVMIIIKITNDNSAAKFVAYIQPILLTIAIVLYATSVSVQKVVNRKSATARDSLDEHPNHEAPPALNITPDQDQSSTPMTRVSANE